MPTPVVGIDLGTTNSVVSVWDWENNRAIILSNEQGNRLNPSVVSYSGNDLLVGESARAKLSVIPENTIFNAKRVIGRRFSQLWKEDLDAWPFTIVGTNDDRARYKVTFNGKETLVSPEEISAFVLFTLKSTAERHFGEPVTKAVITVPAYFTEPQKRATRNAGELAGLEVVGLLTEPTAAALAYGLDTDAGASKEDGAYVLVFDLGGGTLDVSVLRLDGQGSFVTKAVTGDFHLGGEDFDERLLQHVLQQFETDYKHVELNQRSIRRVKAECERLKRLLSSTTDVILDVELQGMEVCYDLTRDDFESLCEDLFECAMGEVDAALELAQLGPEDIDDVVLVGGSTRIPRVQELLQGKFPGKKLWTGLNPDEAVALGAAIQAAALTVQQEEQEAAAAATQQKGAQARSGNSAAASASAAPSTNEVKDSNEDDDYVDLDAESAAAVGPKSQQSTAASSSQQPGQRSATPAMGGKQPAKVIVKKQPTAPGDRQPLQPPPASKNQQHADPNQQQPTGAASGGKPDPSSKAFLRNLSLTSVTAMTLGLELADGNMDVLVPRGTPIPAKKKDFYTTSVENQTSVVIRIYEGDKKKAKANGLLGKFSIKVPPGPIGEAKVEVEFSISKDGLFHVKAIDTQTLKETSITISGVGLSNDEKEAIKKKKRGDGKENTGQQEVL